MPNANRDKGIRAERAVVDYLRPWWPAADRSVATGYRTKDRVSTDRGDIRGICYGGHPVAIQVKDVVKSHPKGLAGKALNDILTEARTQRDECDAVIGLVIEKRAGHASAGEWWVHLDVLELHDLLDGFSRHHPAEELVFPVRCLLSDLVPLLARRNGPLAAASHGDCLFGEPEVA